MSDLSLHNGITSGSRQAAKIPFSLAERSIDPTWNLCVIYHLQWNYWCKMAAFQALLFFLERKRQPSKLSEPLSPYITDDIRGSLAKYLCLYLRAFFIVFLSFKERGISWIIYEIWVSLAHYQSFYLKDLFWSNGHYLKVG